MQLHTNLTLKDFSLTHITIAGIAFVSLIAMWYSLFIAQFSFLFEIDSSLNSVMSSLHSSEQINTFFIFITHLFDPKVFLSWFFILLIILAWKQKTYEALFLFFGVAGGQTIKIIMKWMTDRTRPENPFDLYVHESSFPSGHTMTAIFLALAIGYLFSKNLSPTKKYILYTLLAFIALCVAFSRIFLQVHYCTDVITGGILAIASLSVTILVFTFIKK